MKAMTAMTASMVVAGLFTASVKAAHVDILAYDDAGGLETGYVDVDTGATVLGARLYTQTFDQVFPGLFGSTAPGFFSNTDYPLLPSSDLSFDVLAITNPDTQVVANLLYWDGTGDVDFDTPAAGTTFRFRLSSVVNTTVDGGPSDVPGFVIDGTGPDGVLHKHISYAAYGVGGADPADGFYLVSIGLSMPGLTDSEPVYLLFNADYERDGQNNIVYVGDAPQVDMDSQALAEAWIEQVLLGPALVGDLNGDGFVGIGDLNIVLGAWNRSVPPGDPMADPSGDGFVGIADLNEVLGNWNAGTPPVEVSIDVPEPGVALWIGVAGLPGVTRRRAVLSA